MSYQPRPLTSNLRHTSIGGFQNSTTHSPALLARINEKKLELENLKELRNLSAALAEQMQNLEQKLAVLSDGAEAVAVVLSNWHNVLRAINLASLKIPRSKDATDDAEAKGDKGEAADTPLPHTLVRVPAYH